MKNRRFWLIVILVVMLGLSLSTIPKVRMAASIGTGVGLNVIQNKVDQLHRLGKKNKLDVPDLEWIKELYFVLASGARATLVLPVSSKLMFHYLEGTGTPVQLSPEVFSQSDRVIEMKKQLNSAVCNGKNSVKSPVFDMGGRTPADSAFALYFGTLSTTRLDKKILYTAVMPWKWPTYQEIHKRYGSYDKEIFPIPNMLSIISRTFGINLGPPLYLPNALGGELERMGLAKSFEVSSHWTEELICSPNKGI